MNIAWNQLITKAMKERAAVAQVLADAVANTARHSAIADNAIAPLQDAVDIGDATATQSWRFSRPGRHTESR